MWSALAAGVDFAHALFMAAWVLGLPLLFLHRWTRLTRAFASYAIAFVALNLASRALLGECFLTALSQLCWDHAARAAGHAPVPREWFTVRAAEMVFRLTPSHRGVKLASEGLIFVTAVGVLVSALKTRRRPSQRATNQPVPYATKPTRMTTAKVPKRPNVA
jgi:hypothetical protein